MKSYISSILSAEREREGDENRALQRQRLAFAGCRIDLEQKGVPFETIRDQCAPSEFVHPTPAKSKSEIEGEILDKYVASGRPLSSAYTRASRSILSVLLLSIWIGMFANLVACLCAFTLAMKSSPDSHSEAQT
jgi:hypothetical protein